jgi:hypothetical protein
MTNTWKQTSQTSPAWRGASKWTNESGESIVWDGTSRFYAIPGQEKRHWIICNQTGSSPVLQNDTQFPAEECETHYLGVGLRMARIAFELGRSQALGNMLDDGK